MIISRTAENCFWLSRNIERVQMLTNAIDVAYNVELEIYGDAEDIWYPLVVVLGGKEAFIKNTATVRDLMLEKFKNF